jgi:hypothetical protein
MQAIPMGDRTDDTSQPLPLPEAVRDLLEECRMVLPGIQALFGFQLIATFSDRFARDLSTQLQHLHLLAIALIAIAIGLIMTPAAYHRQYAPQQVSQTLIRISSALLLASMPPLAMGICLDFYVVAYLVMATIMSPGGRRGCWACTSHCGSRFRN